MRRSTALLPAPAASKFCTALCHTSTHPVLVRHSVCACIFIKLTADLWFWAVFTVFRVHMSRVATDPCWHYMVVCAQLRAIRCKKNHVHPRSGSEVNRFLVSKYGRAIPIFGPLKTTHTPHRCTDARRTLWTHAHDPCASFGALVSNISVVGAPQ
jgi:hypothetical protein